LILSNSTFKKLNTLRLATSKASRFRPFLISFLINYFKLFQDFSINLLKAIF
jgi:hypothetical protein